jgi:hypothetical protein
MEGEHEEVEDEESEDQGGKSRGGIRLLTHLSSVPAWRIYACGKLPRVSPVWISRT